MYSDQNRTKFSEKYRCTEESRELLTKAEGLRSYKQAIRKQIKTYINIEAQRYKEFKLMMMI